MVRNKEEFPSSRLAAFLAAAPPTAAAKGKRSRLTSDAASPDPVEALPAIAFPDAAVTLPQRSPRPRWIAGPLVEPEANARKAFWPFVYHDLENRAWVLSVRFTAPGRVNG